MGKKGGDAPAPPDYEKILPLQSAEDRKSLQYTLDQMRVSQESPYGSQSWERTNPTDGSAPQWTYRQTLSPEQQQLYDRDIASKLQQSQLLQGSAGQVQNAMSGPLDTSGLPQGGQSVSASGVPQAGQLGRLGPGQIQSTGPVGSAASGFDPNRQNSVADSLYNQSMRFAGPEMERADEKLRGTLIQSGFQEGSEGYERERNRLMQQQELQKADMRDRAILASGQEDSRRFGQDIASSQYAQGLAGARDSEAAQRFGANSGAQAQEFGQGLQSSQAQFGQNLQAQGMNQQLRDQALREQMMLRQLPLNELNALRTGAQVNLPSNPAQYGSPQLPSQDLVGAANSTYQNQMDAYNAQQQSSQGMMSGLMGLAGTALGGPLGGMLGTALGGTLAK